MPWRGNHQEESAARQQHGEESMRVSADEKETVCRKYVSRSVAHARRARLRRNTCAVTQSQPIKEDGMLLGRTHNAKGDTACGVRAHHQNECHAWQVRNAQTNTRNTAYYASIGGDGTVAHQCA